MWLSKSMVHSYDVNTSRAIKQSEYIRCDDLFFIMSNFYSGNKAQLNEEDSKQILTMLKRIEKHGRVVEKHVKQEMFQKVRALQRKYLSYMR